MRTPTEYLDQLDEWRKTHPNDDPVDYVLPELLATAMQSAYSEGVNAGTLYAAELEAYGRRHRREPDLTPPKLAEFPYPPEYYAEP